MHVMKFYARIVNAIHKTVLAQKYKSFVIPLNTFPFIRSFYWIVNMVTYFYSQKTQLVSFCHWSP